MDGNADALRTVVYDHFREQGGVCEVRLRLATDIEQMPVEDATVAWPENAIPYIAVACLDVSAQSCWDNRKVNEIEEGMAFSPWHGLAAHRPLGDFMRVRKPSYEMSAEFRSSYNECPIREPR